MTPTGPTQRPLEQCGREDGHAGEHAFAATDRIWATIAFGAARCAASRYGPPTRIEQAEADRASGEEGQ